MRDWIISAFTSDSEIAENIVQAWPVLCVFSFFGTTQSMGFSMIRGTGKQSVGAICTSTAYVVIGIPLAYYCAIVKEMGTWGLWIGPAAASAYLTVMSNLLIACINWQ